MSTNQSINHTQTDQFLLISKKKQKRRQAIILFVHAFIHALFQYRLGIDVVLKFIRHGDMMQQAEAPCSGNSDQMGSKGHCEGKPKWHMGCLGRGRGKVSLNSEMSKLLRRLTRLGLDVPEQQKLLWPEYRNQSSNSMTSGWREDEARPYRSSQAQTGGAGW